MQRCLVSISRTKTDRSTGDGSDMRITSASDTVQMLQLSDESTGEKHHFIIYLKRFCMIKFWVFLKNQSGHTELCLSLTPMLMPVTDNKYLQSI